MHNDGNSIGLPTKLGRLICGDPASSASGFEDIAPEVVRRMAGRNPACTVVIVDNAPSVPGVMLAVAQALTTLAAGHPKANFPVLCLDAEKADQACDELRDNANSLFSTQAVIAVDFTQRGMYLPRKVSNLAFTALELGVSVMLVVTFAQWFMLADDTDLIALGVLSDDGVDATRYRNSRNIQCFLADEIAATEAFHKVRFDTQTKAALQVECAGASAQPGTDISRQALVRRLEHAALSASLRHASVVNLRDLQVEAQVEPRPSPSREDLYRSLGNRVHGQSDAITRVAARAALKPGLRVDSNRPRASMLLLGPSGVGKTETARALADALDSSGRGLIRVDLGAAGASHSAATLLGSPPGYIGSDRPDQWLTTRVLRQPNAVLLLDEFEKAHPDLANSVFLELLGNGTLTDMQGRTVDARGLTVVMTSNVGSANYRDTSAGFSDAASGLASVEQAALSELAQHFAPEFLNRIDDIIPFAALTDLRARSVVDALLERFAERAESVGYTLTIGRDIGDFLVETGTSRKFGARNLQRVLETQLAEPLSDMPSGAYSVSLRHGQVVFDPPHKRTAARTQRRSSSRSSSSS